MSAFPFLYTTAILGFGLAIAPSVASGQQVIGVLGSPAATITSDGKQLPPPDPKFGGVIKEKSESTHWWPPRVVPPKGATNVLLIMTDDVGFGAPGTFDGVAPTRSWIGSRRRACAT